MAQFLSRRYININIIKPLCLITVISANPQTLIAKLFLRPLNIYKGFKPDPVTLEKFPLLNFICIRSDHTLEIPLTPPLALSLFASRRSCKLLEALSHCRVSVSCPPVPAGHMASPRIHHARIPRIPPPRPSRPP